MSVEDAVHRHYAKSGIETLILDALRASGRDPETLTADDLSAVDEFHMGGRAATAELAEALQLRPEHRLLDIGSGLGGPARCFARQSGCHVTGVDLTADYVSAATALTRRVGLAGQVDFKICSALALPFEAASFDAATLIHVGMNVADKDRLFVEAARVLRSGGLFGLYDVMRRRPGEIAYPVVWAGGPEVSFLAEPDVYRRALEQAGFVLLEERDRSGLAGEGFRRARARAAQPPLGLHLLMGPEAVTKIANTAANLENGLIAPVMILARRA